DEARRVGSAAAEVSDNAPARIEEIRKRLPVLRFEAKDDLSGAKVLLDGSPVAPALIGTDIPVDPGKHVFAMERAGATALHKEVSAEERGRHSIELEEQSGAQEAAAPVPSARAPAPSSAPTPPDTTSSNTGRWPAFVAAGVSVLSFGTAGVLF